MPTPYPPEPGPDESDKGEVRFATPEGFDLEGREPGDTVEAVAELEVEENGKLCLKKLNGIEVQGYSKPKPRKGFADTVMEETVE